MKPHLIRYIGLHLTSEVGANDALLGVRVVPAGHDGPRVFGRTLRDHETDSGEPVAFYPYAGEDLHFPSGSIQVHLGDVDHGNEPGPDGYAPVANTLWTWLAIGVPTDPPLFRFLFAAARRLDTAHAFRVNQLRLWLATFAHVLIEALRRLALGRTELARATAQTIRLRLLKIGAVVTLSVRRVRLALSESCPHQTEFIAACRALGVAAR